MSLVMVLLVNGEGPRLLACEACDGLWGSLQEWAPGVSTACIEVACSVAGFNVALVA